MFFSIFILLCLKYFPTNSLDCMTNTIGTLFGSPECTIELDIKEKIPDDSVLTASPTTCAIREADIVTLAVAFRGSCYAQVSIDYSAKKMKVKLNHVTIVESLKSPYDDMFGFAKGVESIVQYKITGNLATGEVNMTTRIQCDTDDNCALNKLRKLLPNLTISDTRMTIFKETIKFLNDPDTTHTPPLVCTDASDAPVSCLAPDNQCEFSHSKFGGVTKGCGTYTATPYDLEYRFNIIEQLKDGGTDDSAKAFKSSYACKTSLCNSDDNFLKLDGLLNAFAFGASAPVIPVPSATTNTSAHRPAPVVHPSAGKPGGGKPTSDGISFIVSPYYRSIIMFSLLIQILSI